MNKERLVQIARKVFGESAILPFDELQLLSKAIRNDALEEASQKAFSWNTAMTDVLAKEIRSLKEQP